MSPDPSRFYTLSLHDALPISSLRVLMKLSSHLEALSPARSNASPQFSMPLVPIPLDQRSEEHTSELQSRGHLVCRLLLEKKNFFNYCELHSARQSSLRLMIN